MDAIDEILVEVPKAQAWIVDRPDPPETRMASIVSVQYLCAVAIVAPEKLLDVRRTPPFLDDRVQKLMTRVRVQSSSRLARHHPRAWPARVTIHCGSEKLESEILHPRGDVESEFGWEDVTGKLVATSASEEEAKRRHALAEQIRSLHKVSELPDLNVIALWARHRDKRPGRSFKGEG